MKKRKQPWKLPLRGSEIFAGLGHIMDATNEVVLVAVVPKDGEPCADRLDARRECAIAAINSASAAQATISAADAFVASLDPGALELGSLGLLEQWKAALLEFNRVNGE